MAEKTNTIHGRFYFDPGDAIYPDHFPGNPVVPGSVIVHAFCLAGEAAGFDRNKDKLCQVENFRFIHFVAPGEYAYILVFNPGSGIHCTLYDNDKKLATGILLS